MPDLKADSRDIASTEPDDDEIDTGPFLVYLNSDKGHEIASRALKIIEDIKKATIDTTSSHVKFEKTLQLAMIFAVIISTSVLTYFDKFDSTVGVLFGTLVGYLFGKK